MVYKITTSFIGKYQSRRGSKYMCTYPYIYYSILLLYTYYVLITDSVIELKNKRLARIEENLAKKREKEIKKEEKRKVEAENRRIEEERRTSVALQRKKDRKRILDENDEEDSESVDDERKNILFKWKDVKWVNVANTGWMGIGRKEMVLKKVDLASPKGKGSFKKKKW